jgi:DUF1680 family protein
VAGKPVIIEQQNQYPWSGDLAFNVSPKSALSFNLLVRIPGWARNEAIPSDLYRFAAMDGNKPVIKVNGQLIDYDMEKGYAVIARGWKKGDRVEVSLPMAVRRVVANEKVKDDIGKMALQRGPIMYCAEWPDNNGLASNIIVPANTTFTARYEPGLLNGVEVLTAEVPVVSIDANGQNISTARRTMTAIPYYAWANRGKGEMMLWFPTRVNDVDLLTAGPEGNIKGK